MTRQDIALMVGMWLIGALMYFVGYYVGKFIAYSEIKDKLNRRAE